MIHLDKCNPKLRERIERQISVEDAAKQPVFSHTEGSGSDLNGGGGVQTLVKRLKRLKQGLVKMNQLEVEFYTLIKDWFVTCPPVRCQKVTFVLAPGVRYCPDFFCARWPDLDFASDSGAELGPQKATAIEVKGKKSWDDAIVKIKMAATIWPEINWWFVDRHNGIWRWQRMI